MSEPKRQHWVPRFYLRHFLVPSTKRKEQRVWVFHRKNGDPFLTAINNIAAENYLYSPQQKNGSRNYRLEKKLADLESDLAKIWPRLATEYLDLGKKGIRRMLGLFMAIQFLRHPDRREQMVGIRQKIIEFVDRQPKDDQGLPQVTHIKIGSKIHEFDRNGWDEYRNHGRDFDERAWLWTIETEAVRYAETLMAKRWSILQLKSPLFVTSDYPFYVPTPEMEKFHIRKKAANCFFPICPTRILCMDDLDEPADQYYPLEDNQADQYNLLTWVNTDGFMISARNIFEVLLGIDRLRDQFDREA